MRVILFLLKCLVGLFATVGFLGVLAVVGLTLAVRESVPWERKTAELPEEMVLLLDLSGQVIETRPDNLLSRSSLGGMTVLRDTVDALERARKDERVKGLVLRFGPARLGVGQAQELRDALLAFRGEDRFAIGFAESFGEFGNGTLPYYLASALDQVWLQPSGDIGAMGVILETPFLRGTLDKIGVLPRLSQREEYKGAMNTFTDRSLPEPQRRNLQRLADSWMEQIVAAVAEARKLSPGEVRALIDRAPLSAAEAEEAGLLDRLGYWDELVEEIEGRTVEDIELLPLRTYIAGTRGEEPAEDAPRLALVYGLGPITLSRSQNDPVFGNVVFGSDTVAQAIADAIDDPDIEAILFRVDSPGGSYVASDTVHREVLRAKEAGKPVIVSMGNLAASGGYFVSMPAEKIVAQPGTVTGSIGVFAGKFVLSGLWDWAGLNWDRVQAGENAGIWSQNSDFTEEQWQRLQASLDRIYADFRSKVSQGRGLNEEETRAAAKGQIWTGADAKELGLVDELGGFSRAVALAKESAGIDADAEVVLQVFPPERDPFEALIEDTLGEELESSGASAALRWVARIVRLVDPLIEAAESLGEDPRSRALAAPEIRLAD